MDADLQTAQKNSRAIIWLAQSYDLVPELEKKRYDSVAKEPPLIIWWVEKRLAYS
jgi:hypothetical protein